ncbi:carbohydrate esterase family 16 protein [Collybiopsis luxurians FD-317 M1]|uniref:Unplaced genomic scaffold GYMLUscaffold_46, whole genome shotgun sequence n=1 Tax=Collybiopsis luxurians FD-317 M1 TaxID=944289 RepID=A0A0D0CNK6_9AGAR|nr:carbohydrate esterase family 16 protein [Collybiopsis luxurians FD-317 M1]
MSSLSRLFLVFPVLLALGLGYLGNAPFQVAARITDVVLFGDSYTDQSRAHSIANGSFPGKDYQEVFPPIDFAADGGVQWPWYLGLYGNYTIWNYAVGGAVCSNNLTPLFDEPDVISGQEFWFIQDHIDGYNTSKQRLLLDPSSFVVIQYIGTNDVGINSFVTFNESANVSLPNVADCQLDHLRAMHKLGARNFILNSLIPLQLTKLYSNSSDPTIYFPHVHDGNAWNNGMYNLVHSLNRMLSDGVKVLNGEWGGEGRVEWFDTYGFFEEMYNNPTNFFNGSIPANVTGHCHQCPDPDDFTQCGIGDCTLDERDSYMWWDELHPSEQTGRNLAMETFKKIEGKSKF